MNKRLGLLTAGIAMVLVAGGGTALATVAGPVDSSGVIHGCFTNGELRGSHALVMQDAGTACPNGTTAVSWSEQGPAGATGAAGSAGAAGPPGPGIIGNCEVQVVLSPAVNVAKGAPGAEFDAYFNSNSAAIRPPSSKFTIFSNDQTPTAPVIYIAVRSIPVTQSVNYTLTWNAIACPSTSTG